MSKPNSENPEKVSGFLRFINKLHSAGYTDFEIDENPDSKKDAVTEQELPAIQHKFIKGEDRTIKFFTKQMKVSPEITIELACELSLEQHTAVFFTYLDSYQIMASTTIETVVEVQEIANIDAIGHLEHRMCSELLKKRGFYLSKD